MTTRGEKVCQFIERYCLIPEGSKVGQPIKLLDFQRKFVLDVYDNPAGTSRAYLSVARKNGKSALIAAIVLAHLVGPEAKQNSQIIVVRDPAIRRHLFSNLLKRWSDYRRSYQILCV